MKKLILVGLLLVSWVYGKSVEQVQSEWQQRLAKKTQEQIGTLQQNGDFRRLNSHCYQLKDSGACHRVLELASKFCNDGFAAQCVSCVGTFSGAFPEVNEQWGVEVDIKKAQIYADKACAMDADFCAVVAQMFATKDINLALKYAEKACEKGELAGCAMSAEFYINADINKNKAKIKYYTDKLCKGGVSETCGR